MAKIFDATLDIVPATGPIEQGASVFNRLFLEHPRSIGESYLEHQRCALGFGFSLLVAGLACMVHGLVPGLFVRTGSDAITRLHDLMIARQARAAADRGQPRLNSGAAPTMVASPAQSSASVIPAQRRFT
jgi:hypothetical protein